MARKKFALLKEDYTILVVDDQKEVLESVTPLLKREGYRVLCTESGIEAVKTVKNERVDLMLLDYFMPGMTGEEVVKEIRQFDPELFILLQTGYSGQKPPLEMLRILDIQGYHDKTEGPDKLLLWVAAGIRSCAQMRTNRHMREGLTCILNSVPYIFRVQAFVDLLKDILEHFTGLIDFQNGFIAMENYQGETSVAYGKGRFEYLSYNQIMQDTTIRCDIVARAKQHSDTIQSEDILVLPIVNDSKWIGMIYLESCKVDKEEYLDLVKIYVNQAVEAIINVQLHNEVVLVNEKIKESYTQLRKTYFELIDAFTKAVDAKDAYTAGHSTRVSIYARLIGKSIGLAKDELVKLKVASLFHDIGKIGIPDGVLLKEGKLSDMEFSVIKTHPEIGSKILSPVTMLKDIIPGVRHHHEKFDGSGYPNHLAGEDIPLIARILTIADSFDAMTSNRSYQRKRSFEEALEEVRRCAGTQFDLELANCFVNEFKNNYKYVTRLISFWDTMHNFNSPQGNKKPFEYPNFETAAGYAAATLEVHENNEE